jgi:hypothetical protein
MPKAARLWPAGAAVPDWVRVRPHEVAWLRWLPQGPLLFTLVAGAREAAGHPSGLQIAANTGMAIDTSLATCAGHQPSGGWSFRKQRTVNPLIVPARFDFFCSSSRPAYGRPSAVVSCSRRLVLELGQGLL